MYKLILFMSEHQYSVSLYFWMFPVEQRSIRVLLIETTKVIGK